MQILSLLIETWVLFTPLGEITVLGDVFVGTFLFIIWLMLSFNFENFESKLSIKIFEWLLTFTVELSMLFNSFKYFFGHESIKVGWSIFCRRILESSLFGFAPLEFIIFIKVVIFLFPFIFDVSYFSFKVILI